MRVIVVALALARVQSVSPGTSNRTSTGTSNIKRLFVDAGCGLVARRAPGERSALAAARGCLRQAVEADCGDRVARLSTLALVLMPLLSLVFARTLVLGIETSAVERILATVLLLVFVLAVVARALVGAET